jgi:hypothetical protein
VFPFADLCELGIAELMPTARQPAVNKRLDHPWRTMDDWDIFPSAGRWEHDSVSGVEDVNTAWPILSAPECVTCTGTLASTRAKILSWSKVTCSGRSSLWVVLNHRMSL